ncbi:MAG TPA: alpha-amylase family protein [Verrucomicrobiae bacterium]
MRTYSLLLASLLALPITPALAQNPPRLKRADSFLGIHFDFHAGPDCTEIGKNTTREMILDVIDKVHPDYLQIDCKGHRGLSSYPTKVGNPAPGFVGDPLRLWRQVTAEKGVSLYMHYSGVWDSEAIIRHPDWAAVNGDGKTNGNATSLFGPYVDQLLIPQLRELAGVYKIDGVWIDGDCWAAVPDYSEPAMKAWGKSFGLDSGPRPQPNGTHWFDFLQFNREAFRAYLRHYITEVRKTNPEFQSCSNWAFSDHMPEAVCAPVDFLSGDYSPQDSVNSARISARYLARQGKPWDLMAWSFTTQAGKDGATQKSALQLQREAAVVLAMGGGFQAYFTQKRDGSVRSERMPVMGEVAKFCRARQAFCHHATQVPQIALLYSTTAHYLRANGLFPRDHSPFSGTLQALLESQQSVELLGEHQLSGRMREYPLIVVPEWEYLAPEFNAELVEYVKQGGTLLLIGPRTAPLFERELDVKIEASKGLPTVHLAHDNELMSGVGLRVQCGATARPFGRLQTVEKLDAEPYPAATIAPVGKGRIAALYFSFSPAYLKSRSQAGRKFLNLLVHELFPKPIVEVSGSPDVDVVVNRLGGKLAINLINTSGPHRTEPIIESIPPAGPLSLAIRQSVRPQKITLQPAGQPLAFEHSSGEVRVKVPPVQVHDILVVE